MPITPINPLVVPAKDQAVYNIVLVKDKHSQAWIENGQIKCSVVLNVTLCRVLENGTYEEAPFTTGKNITIPDAFLEAANDPEVFGALLASEMAGIQTYITAKGIF
jgi:hypothetical protein